MPAQGYVPAPAWARNPLGDYATYPDAGTGVLQNRPVPMLPPGVSQSDIYESTYQTQADYLNEVLPPQLDVSDYAVAPGIAGQNYQSMPQGTPSRGIPGETTPPRLERRFQRNVVRDFNRGFAEGGQPYFPQPYPGGMPDPNINAAPYFMQGGGAFDFQGDPNDPMYNQFGFDDGSMSPAETGDSPYAMTEKGDKVGKMKWKGKGQGVGQYAPMIMPALDMISSIAEQGDARRNEARLQELKQASNVFTPTSNVNRGKHTVNQGYFDPANMVPVQFTGNDQGYIGSPDTYSKYGGQPKYPDGGDVVMPQDNTAMAQPAIPDLSNIKPYDPSDTSYRQNDNSNWYYNNPENLAAMENLYLLGSRKGMGTAHDPKKLKEYANNIAEFRARMKPEVLSRYDREKKKEFFTTRGGLLRNPERIEQRVSPGGFSQPQYQNGGDVKKMPRDNTRTAPVMVPQQIREGNIQQLIDDTKRYNEQIANLQSPYTTIAMPDRNTSWPGDSIRFFPGQRGNFGVPYVRDGIGAKGFADQYSGRDYLDMVNHNKGRMYQDTSRVRANHDIMYNEPAPVRDYQDGGEYYLSEEEIKQVMAMGGQIEYL